MSTMIERKHTAIMFTDIVGYSVVSIDSEKYYSKYSHNIRDKQREHEGSNHYSIPQ